MKFLWEVKRLIGNKPFDCDADPDHDTNPEIYKT